MQSTETSYRSSVRFVSVMQLVTQVGETDRESDRLLMECEARPCYNPKQAGSVHDTCLAPAHLRAVDAPRRINLRRFSEPPNGGHQHGRALSTGGVDEKVTAESVG